MTTPTSPWNIPLFASTDTIPSLEGVLNSQSNALNTALNTVQLTSYSQYTTFAAMNAVSGTVHGQHATVTSDATASNNTDYFWDGAHWQALRASGLVPVIPTSVSGTGVVLGAGGQITATGASAITINGCFTTGYENYKLIGRYIKSAAADLVIKFGTAGTPDATTTYASQRNIDIGTGATVPLAQGPSAGVAIDQGIVTTRSYIEVEVSGPFLSQETFGIMWSTAVNGTPFTARGSFFQSAVASFTDAILSVSSGAVTGTFRLYGYNNN